MVLNSCRVHAEFMLISCWFHFQPELHNALYSNWDQIGVESIPNFMLNSCWLSFFTLNFDNVLCSTLHNNGVEFMLKIQGKNEISMKSAKTQHEFGMNSTPIWSQLLYKTLCNSGWKWNQHEFGMNSTPIWLQWPYQAFLVMINYRLS